MAQRIYCNRNWRFSKSFENYMVSAPIQSAKIVDIPHAFYIDEDFSDESENNYFCYQKSIFAPPQWEGAVVEIVFEAVAHSCDLYINGVFVEHNDCGFLAFSVDISKYLNINNENLITLRGAAHSKINQPPFCDGYDEQVFGGVHRDVYFSVKDAMHIDEIYIKPLLLEKISTNRRTPTQIRLMKAQGIIKTECILSKAVFNPALNEELFVRQYMDDAMLLSQPVGGMEKLDNGYKLCITSAPLTIKLWDVESPQLYKIKTQIVLDDKVVDEQITEVGFRRVSVNANGFYLNGRRLVLRGVNYFDEPLICDCAKPESMQRFDVKLMKEELCLNAVRIPNAIPSKHFVEECDRVGLLVFLEILGKDFCGDLKWKDIELKNLEKMIIQYRNHPSIAAWGSRVKNAPCDDFYNLTYELAAKMDAHRPVFGCRKQSEKMPCEDIFALANYEFDDKTGGCIPRGKLFANEEKTYIISEFAGHAVFSKMSDTEDARVKNAIWHARFFDSIYGSENISGAFVNCFADYLKKSKDYRNRINYFGVMDVFRNKKLSADFYRSFLDGEPVLSVTSDFLAADKLGKKQGENYVFTNADSIKMYINDEFIKEYLVDDSAFKNLVNGPVLIDDYIGDSLEAEEGYSKGEGKVIKNLLNMRALGKNKLSPEYVIALTKAKKLYHIEDDKLDELFERYILNENQKEITYKFEAYFDEEKKAEKILSNRITPKLKLSVSHTLLTEIHSFDVALVRILVCDQFENQVYDYNGPLKFEVEGPIEIIGNEMISAEGGAAGVYIKSLGEDGDAKLKIHSADVPDVTVNFSVECMRK